ESLPDPLDHLRGTAHRRRSQYLGDVEPECGALFPHRWGAEREDLGAFIERRAQPCRSALPHRAVDLRQLVAQAEVPVPAGIALDSHQFAAHPDRREAILDPRLDRSRQARDGPGVVGSAHAPCRIVAACRVLLSTIAMVTGPIPPGTGVIAPATWRAASKSTSPTTR